MNPKLFSNDNITGNSLIGFEIKGVFKDDENVLLEKLKDILNRNITYSNNDYRLLEPSDLAAVVMKSNSSYIIKTPMYSYFEAIYVMPRIMEYMKNLKHYKNSHLYIKIGFNNDFLDLSKLNILKFIFEFKEDVILKDLGDITKKTNIKKLSDLKPNTLLSCNDNIQKQVETYRFLTPEEDNFGISFADLNNGYILFKYPQDINYRDKWEEILKDMNHTIVTLYNTTTNDKFDDKEIEKIDKLNKSFHDYATAFGCYEMFLNRFKSIKLTVDLNNDKAVVDTIFSSIREKLFNITIYNNITDVNINYDTDVSKLQIQNIDLKNCYHIDGIDIVNCDIIESYIKECDLYDCNIKDSQIDKCSLFGYANANDSKFKDCYISQNIKLKDCDVKGALGKMGGTMIGGSLEDTTVLVDLADIHDNVEKDNVNEIK